MSDALNMPILAKDFGSLWSRKLASRAENDSNRKFARIQNSIGFDFWSTGIRSDDERTRVVVYKNEGSSPRALKIAPSPQRVPSISKRRGEANAVGRLAQLFRLVATYVLRRTVVHKTQSRAKQSNPC